MQWRSRQQKSLYVFKNAEIKDAQGKLVLKRINDFWLDFNITEKNSVPLKGEKYKLDGSFTSNYKFIFHPENTCLRPKRLYSNC